VTEVYKLLFLNVFFVLLVGGCASAPLLPVGPDAFGLKGKVAVRDAGEQFTANFLWQQNGEDFEIDLWGPLGQGRVQLQRQGPRVVLVNGRGEILTEGDADSVMRAHLGWSLPMDVLPAWIQGQPLPGAATENLDVGLEGEIAAFDQLGWHVELDRYERVYNRSQNRLLPGRLTADNGMVRVRLVVSEWQI
jgi:outer membrane lipoprotein LolB